MHPLCADERKYRSALALAERKRHSSRRPFPDCQRQGSLSKCASMSLKRIFGIWFSIAGLIVAALLAGCDKQAGEVGAAQPGAAGAASGGDATGRSATRPLPADSWFAIRVGDKTVQLQLALTAAEQAQGLMGRKSLDTDHGMLFVFSRGKRQSFWMANTPLPLDIGYFDNDGILREVYPLYPFDRTSVVSQRSDIRYALEMAQGWFAQNGIRAGARLDLQMLEAALQNRR